jgi:hypothetical protein
MKSEPKPESGVLPVGEKIAETESDTSRMYEEILDATTIASVNLEFASDGADGERRAALADASAAIERVAALVRTIRRTEPPAEVPTKEAKQASEKREGRAPAEPRATALRKAKSAG